MPHQAKPSFTITGRLLCVGLLLVAAPVRADHNHHDHHNHHNGGYYYGGSALFGGMIANQMMTSMALDYEAERQPPPTRYGDHPDHRTLIERQNHPYQQTTESRLAELDRLAASGAITPKQYKDRRLGIVDGL